MSFTEICISDFIKMIGEPGVQEVLNTFSTPINPEVEFFLKRNAIQFTKQKLSISYLIFRAEDFVGYYTISFRQISIGCDGISKTKARKLERFGEFSESLNAYQIPAFLIAQLGKNYNEKGITGTELLDLALKRIKTISEMIGGGVVFLEAEDHAKLLDFYQRPENGFIPFDERTAADGTKLIQLYRFL